MTVEMPLSTFFTPETKLDRLEREKEQLKKRLEEISILSKDLQEPQIGDPVFIIEDYYNGVLKGRKGEIGILKQSKFRGNYNKENIQCYNYVVDLPDCQGLVLSKVRSLTAEEAKNYNERNRTFILKSGEVLTFSFISNILSILDGEGRVYSSAGLEIFYNDVMKAFCNKLGGFTLKLNTLNFHIGCSEGPDVSWEEVEEIVKICKEMMKNRIK